MIYPSCLITLLQGDIKTIIIATITNEYTQRVDMEKVIKINRTLFF